MIDLMIWSWPGLLSDPVCSPQELRILETKEQTGDISDHGTEVVKQVLEQDGVEEFVKRWRSFFLAKMKPAHLPTGWSVEHRTRDQVAGREESQGDVCGPARQDGEGTSAQVRDEDGSGQVQNGGCSADREPTQINQESDKEDGELWRRHREYCDVMIIVTCDII